MSSKRFPATQISEIKMLFGTLKTIIPQNVGTQKIFVESLFT